MNFHLDIISSEKEIYSGEVKSATIPSSEGQITILARHMPLVAPLGLGEVIIMGDRGIMNFSIGKGVFSISKNHASLLIEDVASADEISQEKALEAKKRAEELIARGVQGEEKIQALYALRRSLVDLNIIRKKKKRFRKASF